MSVDKLKLIETRMHCMDLGSKDKMVQSLDFSGTIIDISPAWLAVTGYERAEVIGKHFVEFLDMNSLLKVQNNFPIFKDYGFIDNCTLNMLRKDRVVLAVTLNGTSKYTNEGLFDVTFCEITYGK